VSLCQHWVRPILRGKQTADVEFGAKIEASLVDGYARIEKLSWDPFNEGGTLIKSVQAFRRDYGHFPKRILVDKIFRTRENLRYCKEHGIHMIGPRLGRRPEDPAPIGSRCVTNGWNPENAARLSVTLAWRKHAIHWTASS
jgi:IS5 family transposase